MDILKTFYNDVHTREAVKEFLLSNLKEEAVERVFDKKAIAGLYEASKCIEKTFSKLEELYGEKPQLIQDSPR